MNPLLKEIRHKPLLGLPAFVPVVLVATLIAALVTTSGKDVIGGDARRVPFFSGSVGPRPFAGLRGIALADIPREFSAGIILAALMIPLNIGYAQVAGLPPAAGLYEAIIPLVVFALLASSRHLVTSPNASMATLVGGSLVAFAAPGEPLRLQYALALAVVCALVFFAF